MGSLICSQSLNINCILLKKQELKITFNTPVVFKYAVIKIRHAAKFTNIVYRIKSFRIIKLNLLKKSKLNI